MRIVITNDDGVEAEGLNHLAKLITQLIDRGTLVNEGLITETDKMINAQRSPLEVIVVAPSDERSGASSSFSRGKLRCEKLHTSPLHLHSAISSVYSVTGTPVDCVKTAYSLLSGGNIDLVLSGINLGSNAGGNILFSGTVGACIEAHMRGIPAIAISQEGRECFALPTIFEQLAETMPEVIRHVLVTKELININIPQAPCHGSSFCSLGASRWVEIPKILDRDEHTIDFFWKARVEREGELMTSDIVALEKGLISVVALDPRSFKQSQVQPALNR